MIRFICRQDDAGMAANVGGAVQTTHHTIDGDVIELERWLTDDAGRYTERKFVGIEIVPAGATKP